MKIVFDLIDSSTVSHGEKIAMKLCIVFSILALVLFPVYRTIPAFGYQAPLEKAEIMMRAYVSSVYQVRDFGVLCQDDSRRYIDCTVFWDADGERVVKFAECDRVCIEKFREDSF